MPDCEAAVAEEANATLNCIDLHSAEQNSGFLDDVLAGFSRRPKSLSPKYFYDQTGSELFEEITRQPEYYPTRTELSIMEESVGAMVERFHKDVTLVELGAGSSLKTRILLRELANRSINVLYVPVDISRDFLFQSAESISEMFPAIEVEAVCADFSHGVKFIGEQMRGSAQQKVVYFPGSTIGNFAREEARTLLRDVAAQLAGDDAMLLGTDLKKDRAVLEAAYNDAKGVTAAFNLNVLRRIKHELGADIPLEEFRHRAFFNEEQSRIEMHLEALRELSVRIGGQDFAFAAGERIHTESSHKYDNAQLQNLAGDTGFELMETWSDPRRYFGVHWLGVKQR